MPNLRSNCIVTVLIAGEALPLSDVTIHAHSMPQRAACIAVITVDNL